jgi:hypothetical protein
MTGTIYPIQRIVNWYFGNFCSRKCFNKDGRLRECYEKLQKFAELNKNLTMTCRQFKAMFDAGHIKICMLKHDFRRKTVGWYQFEEWTRNPAFDADKFE